MSVSVAGEGVPGWTDLDGGMSVRGRESEGRETERRTDEDAVEQKKARDAKAEARPMGVSSEAASAPESRSVLDDLFSVRLSVQRMI